MLVLIRNVCPLKGLFAHEIAQAAIDRAVPPLTNLQLFQRSNQRRGVSQEHWASDELEMWISYGVLEFPPRQPLALLLGQCRSCMESRRIWKETITAMAS